MSKLIVFDKINDFKFLFHESAIRLIGPKPSNDEKDGAALLFRNGNVDIVNNSWGPQDNGITVQNLGEVTRAALKTGVTTVCLNAHQF